MSGDAVGGRVSSWSAPTDTSQTPAGWFDDPWRVTSQRWWDGRQWTPFTDAERVAPGSASGPGLVYPLGGSAGLLGVVVAALVVVAVVVVRITSLDASWPVDLPSLLLAVLVPLAAIVASRRWGSGDPVADLGFAARAVDAPLAVFVAIMAYLLTLIGHMLGLIVMAAVSPGSGFSSTSTSLGRVGFGAAVAAVAVGGVLRPVAAEALMRGLIGRGLIPYLGVAVANAAQVLIGAAVEVPVTGGNIAGSVIAAALIGILCGSVARRTGRLGGAMLGMCLANTLAMVLAFGPV